MTKDFSPKDIETTQIDIFFPPVADSSRIIIDSDTRDFVASRIARAVEDVDANLINLNVISMADSGNRRIVAIRIDHRNPEAAARSLERYGYNILSVHTDDPSDDTLRRRYDEFMHYLSV